MVGIQGPGLQLQTRYSEAPFQEGPQNLKKTLAFSYFCFILLPFLACEFSSLQSPKVVFSFLNEQDYEKSIILLTYYGSPGIEQLQARRP